MKINKNGFWEGEASKFHKHDESLCNALVKFFKDKIVYDLGCGQGEYVKSFNKVNIFTMGMDGNPKTKEIKNCFVFDLTKPLDISAFDWVLSLEVGEHIPKELCQNYIDNLKNLNKEGIVLSWAIPGQGGDGHVNELPNEDVIAMFPEYTYDVEASLYLRSKSALWWFKNTIMVFRKNQD